ncbi:hypothetical protein KIPB_004979 [Kipferlia bialata]|uniref:Ubiquitin-like domain-containing protein n=1 Tax=Kipferlia bialata TaxID=797122 RepID=A0A9K3CXS0_9EUKA|nr:hypothetical protein KIPB_004979 [Kipferlia bialata]|eukprot:g4979.t1
MIVVIQPTAGRSFEIDIPREARVQDVKKIIQERTGVDVAQLGLLYMGRVLRNSDKIEGSVTPGSTVHMVINYRAA